MRWLEEITVRTQPRREKEVIEFLVETAKSVIRNEKVQSARVYAHHSAPGGFSLFLFWNTASVPTQGSDTAMLILGGLKPLGLLNHTVLIEKGCGDDLSRGFPDGGGRLRSGQVPERQDRLSGKKVLFTTNRQEDTK